ncbi:GL26608 [Drosophila persimilis]|uniref:GL26608 n=2 Tax=Drosophila persimilis TaxID=7234 RepID=B4GSV5_DROPE|nr:GL26608 [Drosophila persimilis]
MKQRQQRPPPRPRPPMASSSLIMMPPSPPSPSTQSHKQSQRFASGGHNSSAASSVRLQQFDDYLFESCHYLETNYFAATYRTAMVESSSHEFRPSTNSSSNSFELHEMEPPSVICKAGAPLAATPPPLYQYQYQAETRLTTSGVQTELTVESLAKLSNSASASSSSSSARAPPFFRCCYTPIDRWRERRLVARQQKTSAPSKNGQASQSQSQSHPV